LTAAGIAASIVGTRNALKNMPGRYWLAVAMTHTCTITGIQADCKALTAAAAAAAATAWLLLQVLMLPKEPEAHSIQGMYLHDAKYAPGCPALCSKKLCSLGLQ
jgi:hypothetical protein